MNPIKKIINDFHIMILDGAFSTELERRGCNINDSLWSAKILMENPEIIGQVHYDYFAAGADCATTASYQATVDGFMKKGLSEEEAYKLIKLSVEIAVQQRDKFWAIEENRENRPKPLVAASVGPYGAYLADGSEYKGNYGLTVKQLVDFHYPRMKALVEAKPDVLACETIPCLDEAIAVARLLKKFPGMYAWISFSGKDETHINSGEEIEKCAAALDKFDQVAAIGINCTAPQYVNSLIGEIKKATNKPIIVYPNSGEEYDATLKEWHGNCCGASYGDSAKGWFKSGARLIGGCCRTNPKDIAAIASWARKTK